MLVARTELAYYPEEVLEINNKPKKDIKKVAKRRKNNNSLAKLIIMCVPLIFVSISLSILFGYANLSSVRQEITKLEVQKVELEKEKIDLIGKLEGIKSSTKVAEDAVYKLGMDYPTEGQIVYVSVNEKSIEKVEEPNIINKIKNIFSMVTNFF